MKQIAGEPAAEIAPKSNRFFVPALACLWLIAAWVVTQRLHGRAEYFRLGWFYVGSFASFGLVAGLGRNWYRARDFRGYFLHQMLALTIAVGAARDAGPAWLLILPAVSQAVLFLPPRWMAAVVGMLLVLPILYLAYLPIRYVGLYALNVLASFLFTVGCSYAVRREWESRRQLHEAHEKLRMYAASAEALAAAEERNRLAREIHDGAAHHLTAANVLVEAGVALLPPEAPAAARDAFEKAQGQIRSALGELRDAIRLRAPADENLPLVARIQRLIGQGGFPATVVVLGAVRRLTTEAEHALYRVAQEALTNARKHAPGCAIALTLDFADPQSVSLRSENDEPEQAASGDGAFGLLSLRERILRLGGTFHAGSEKHRGRFVVRAEVAA